MSVLTILFILVFAAVSGLLVGYFLSLAIAKKQQSISLETKPSLEPPLGCGCSEPCSDTCEEPILYQISEPKNE